MITSIPTCGHNRQLTRKSYALVQLPKPTLGDVQMSWMFMIQKSAFTLGPEKAQYVNNCCLQLSYATALRLLNWYSLRIIVRGVHFECIISKGCEGISKAF